MGLGVSNLPLISFLLGFGAEVYGIGLRVISSLPGDGLEVERVV